MNTVIREYDSLKEEHEKLREYYSSLMDKIEEEHEKLKSEVIALRERNSAESNVFRKICGYDVKLGHLENIYNCLSKYGDVDVSRCCINKNNFEAKMKFVVYKSDKCPVNIFVYSGHKLGNKDVIVNSVELVVDDKQIIFGFIDINKIDESVKLMKSLQS